MQSGFHHWGGECNLDDGCFSVLMSVAITSEMDLLETLIGPTFWSSC